ncbi:MAG TPA: Asp-tRNA(Asn)/Glu-tRNA(Gln) amidotransferase subunit GatC [Bacteroidetes bacterium]|nr:Asp-tRNA(Asn)/Glu-tRNA(Gln) amidotransferase subunit GatC [Bacteroidota bacterium]
MKMDLNLVEKLAHLSRLSFNDEEKKKLLIDMNKILDFVDKLNEMDTEGVEELLYINDDVNVLREDIVALTISKKEALKNAALSDSDFFKVSKVIDKK